MNIAFLFAGQGSQYVGMGKKLYDTNSHSKSIFDNMKAPFDIKKLCFEGPKEDLNNTAYTQPCIFTTSLAIAESLKYENIIPKYVAGLSLGEYSALSYSGAFDYTDAINIVAQRAKIMAEALPTGVSTMAAVMGADIPTISEIINNVDGVCEIANYNSPAQIVITGEIGAINEAIQKLKEKKAKCICLNVSGAFHSSLLNEASQKLDELLSKFTIKKTKIPVVYNVTGTHEDDDKIHSLLVKQIKSSVKFMQSVEYMIEKGVDTFIEIGPGKALSGFVKRINKNVTILQIEDDETLNNALEVLKNE